MPRQAVPLAVADVSALSRALEAELSQLGRLPGHLELMNMLARSAGYGNFQHLRASALGEQPAPQPAAARRWPPTSTASTAPQATSMLKVG
jgi:hypothetical protein